MKRGVNMLKIYNTLTRQKEVFTPMTPGKIGLYVCGITVYDQCHLGHARSIVSFDVIVRFLRSVGYEVNYVKNITDIDDKIIQRANEKGVDFETLTAHFIQKMNEDTKALNVLSPDSEPRATAFIPEIIKLISQLIEKNLAYPIKDGDVCFSVKDFNGYGKLSHKDIEGLESGARIEINQEKRSPLDFVLWKKAKPGEPSWPSPWGDGRPGWHIECSAMSMDALGEEFDIHGGGSDLQFPHHENEIAQSEGATSKGFAKYWMHVGMLQVDQEKMSKSLGNFFTIEDVLKKHHPEAVRYFLLTSHYRSQLNYSDENLSNAIKGLSRLYQSLKGVSFESGNILSTWVEQFNEAMFDDFNTPEALAVLFKLSHELNRTKSEDLAATLKFLATTLGIIQEDPEQFLQAGVDSSEVDWINQRIADRKQARADKDWTLADDIRNQLQQKGIEIEDGAEGTTWRKIEN